uniref:Inner centromere protein ARK-binding domain-containing protein n=1 Tax=Noccaea caerulescens TaxID=107243 RepID=A0A1J3IBB8_NOCCA
MFSGRENPRGTATVNLENLFAQIFERKKRIVEQVKQQVDLYDQHLASKCLLEGVSPPSWLWSPSLPSQTSELNKEEIISGLLFPQSRPSFICPSNRTFSYQKPVSFLAGNLVRQDLTSVVNNPLEEQFLEEEQQHDISHNLARRVSYHSHEQDANAASPRDVHGEEGLPESISIGCRENQSCPTPEYSQIQRVENSLDATSPGRSQGKMVPKSVSTTGCEGKPSSPGYCQDETEPSTCPDPGLPLAKIQRSKSRQKALELRSSAKASKSRSNCRNELKPSHGGNIGIEIASLRSESVSEIKLFKHDENDVGLGDQVENNNSQGVGGDQCIKFRSTTESSTPHQKVDSLQKSSSGSTCASIVPESLHQSGNVNEMNILQSTETVDEVSAKVEEQVDDPQSRSGNETACVDGGTISKSSSQDGSKREHQKSGNSFSGDFPSRNSNPSPRADHEVELTQVISITNEVSMVTDAGTNVSQSEINARSRSSARGNRSKTKHSGCVESSAIDVEPSHSISLLQGGDIKESLTPSTIDVEGLVVENTASEVKGECVDANRCSSAGRVSQTGISTDDTTFANANQDSISKTEVLGFVESSAVELQSRHSVMQCVSDDENVLLKPVAFTGEALSLEKDNNGESVEIGSISKSGSISQIDFTIVEPVVVESILQESSIPEDLIDHSKRCDISCGSKEVQPLGSLTKAGSNQCHGRMSRPSIEEESVNRYKALSVGSDHKSADQQLEVKAGNSSLRTHDLPAFVKPESPHFDDNDLCNFDEIPMNSREKSTMEKKAPTPASVARVLDVPSLTDSEVNLSANNEMNDFEDQNVLKEVMVPETESPASHTDFKVEESEPPEPSIFTGHIGGSTKRPQHETSSDKGVSTIKRNIACTETGESHGPESSIQEFFCSNSSMEGSQLQNKRSRFLEKLTSRVPSLSPGGDVLVSGFVGETIHHMEKSACHNLDHYDVELQKMIGSASSNRYDVELQKMIGSASSNDYAVELQKMIGSPAELRLEEGCLFKETGLIGPASLSFRPEQLSVQRSHIALNQGFETKNMEFLPFAGETSHPLASCAVRDSDGSPCLPPLGLIGSDDGSPPLLEGFIVQTDDENQSGSKSRIRHDSFQFPRTAAESATLIEQIRKSACRTTPSLHLAKRFKFDGKLDLDQSVSAELLDGMFFSQNLEDSSVFDNLGINHDYTGRSYTDYLPFSGAGASADVRNPRASPTEKCWYRSLQKSSSSEKRGSQTPDLPCINEENENVDEEAVNLCTNTPMPMNSEKRGSSVLDLPCIAEENENIDEIPEPVNEASDSEGENVSAERKPLGNVTEHPMKFLPSVSKAKIPVDRQSLDSVGTAFSFSATCNNSVKSKVGRQTGGSRRFTGKDKENHSRTGAGRNVKPPSSRISKAKLSCNSSLTQEPRHNNIVSNITSFVPLVQQQKPAAALFTGKRDVKVKALEAAEASKRIAEQKEIDRKMKKEAMKLERARQEQENLRKQEMEKKKKEENRKKKEAELAWKQEMEKKKKEEEQKRKEFEMADRKRQREEEDRKLKEAKRQRIAEIQRQQREADQKIQAEMADKKRQRAEFQRQQREADQKLQAEKESNRQAVEARIKALKELKEEQINAEKTRAQANTGIREVRPKSNSSDETNASRTSRDDDFKVISNPGKMSEESYDISPYKCSDDENEEEDDYDDMSNHKFVPSWASKSNILRTVMSQQQRDHKLTFPKKSFRDITQVLLPRKFRPQ